jgi:CubicO group peptidase (beta-lactamase class C family)
MRKRVFVLLIITSASLTLIAQETVKKLDKYFHQLCSDKQMNGNVAVSENGKLIYERSFGLSEVSIEKPNTPNSQFQLASVSKLFTTVAILQLKERGLLNLDSSIYKYLPEFPYHQITIRHLLTHTSGLPDTEAIFDTLVAAMPFKQFTIHDDISALIDYSRSHSLLFQPGEKWGYSSVGYHILALLVEKTSGNNLASYMKDFIFIPAGMNNTCVQTSLSQRLEPDRTKNYHYSNHFEMKLQWMDTIADWKEWTYNLALMTGAGGIISTTPDLIRFNHALNAGKLINKSTLNEAYTPCQLNNGKLAQPFDMFYCGFGWFIFKDTSNGKIVFGSGSDPGAISFFASNLDRNQCLVVLHNIKCNPFIDLKALDLLNGKSYVYRSSLAFIYAQDICSKGKEFADFHFKTLKQDSLHYVVEESEMERAALEFRRAGLKAQDLAISELNIIVFPNNSEAYKNYAVTLAEYGFKEKAIEMYKKANEINPNDPEIKNGLDKLIKS